ncbi:hypothetical protein T492DRAFT_906633, partial [Pavlovales sp. CCMP2436]
MHIDVGAQSQSLPRPCVKTASEDGHGRARVQAQTREDVRIACVGRDAAARTRRSERHDAHERAVRGRVRL